MSKEKSKNNINKTIFKINIVFQDNLLKDQLYISHKKSRWMKM